jgi:hypothetical protein
LIESQLISSQVIEGWCVARFELFGTRKQLVSNEWMNYLGVILTLSSGIAFVFVKGENFHRLSAEEIEERRRRRRKKLVDEQSRFGISKQKMF